MFCASRDYRSFFEEKAMKLRIAANFASRDDALAAARLTNVHREARIEIARKCTSAPAKNLSHSSYPPDTA
jgi:hypothetical protein